MTTKPHLQLLWVLAWLLLFVAGCASALSGTFTQAIDPCDTVMHLSGGMVEPRAEPGSSNVPRGTTSLIAPGGKKLRQQIARFRAAGGTGGRAEFLEHVNHLAVRAREAGNFVTGTVGRGPQAIPNATIFREGSTFVVVDEAGVVRSFVSNASSGGVVDEFLRLGGNL